MKNPNVQIRLMGDPKVIDCIVQGINIDPARGYMRVSRHYPNRGTGDVRVYVEVTMMLHNEETSNENYRCDWPVRKN